MPAAKPGLYGGRTRLIDESDHELGFSPLFTKSPSFANALVQNIFGGNTMVMNLPAWHLMKAASGPFVATHDWWTYQVISGAGGVIYYDPNPKVRYRQHANNLIGANNSFFARLARIKMLLQGRFKEYNTISVTGLLTIKHLLTPDNQRLLNDFAKARKANLLTRLRLMRQAKIYRQTFLGMIGLWVAVLLGKF